MFPLPPKPTGVIAPEFLNVLKNEQLNPGDTDDESTSSDSSTQRERSSTGRRVRRGRNKEVNYSELTIDNDGNDDEDSSSGGRKRKQPVKKGATKRGGKKSNKKRRSSTSTSSMTDSSDVGSESDFTIELSGDEASDSDDDSFGTAGSDKEQDEYANSKQKARKVGSIQWNEIPLEASGLESHLDRVDHERLVNYRQAAEQVKHWLETVDTLELPPNPLDRLLNELGGPEKVAELTGRKTRQVEVYDALLDKKKVIYEKRKGEGRIDQINIEEKDAFQKGVKKIAILSEAASTGISLQADKRVKNQRR